MVGPLIKIRESSQVVFGFRKKDNLLSMAFGMIL